MRVLLFLLLTVASQGAASTLGNQVKSLIGARLNSSLAIINRIDEVDYYGRTVLHHAAMLGDLPLVEFFINHGAYLMVSDNSGLIPLQYAQQIAVEQQSVPHMRIMSLLLEKTEGVNGGDEAGWRPIVWSIMARDIPRIEELLANGAEIFGPQQHNAIWAAEHLNDERIIKILSRYISARDFRRLIRSGSLELVQTMVEQIVDQKVLNTALLYLSPPGPAVRTKMELVEFDHQQLALMKLLVKADSDVNAIGGTGNASPLTKAIRSLRAPLVRFLLRQGAVAGNIDRALEAAENTAIAFGNYPGYEAYEYPKNFAKIKQLLADKNLLPTAWL